MKVQELYENALALVGKNEEGTSYPFMDRVPSLLNPEIYVLNSFRDEDAQIDTVIRIDDEIDLTAKEAQGLSLCLAYAIATEINGYPEARTMALYQQRNRVMGSICTEMEEIEETIGVS